MALDISRLTKTGDFINYKDSGGYVKLTFGNVVDKFGNDVKLLQREIYTVAGVMNFLRGNLSGPINGNFAGAGQQLTNLDTYLRAWKKIYMFKNLLVYLLEHIMYNDSSITYTSKNHKFSATYIATNMTKSIEEGKFAAIYDAINEATNLTDIKDQLTEADRNGDIVDEIDLDALEASITAEIDIMTANIGLARLAN